MAEDGLLGKNYKSVITDANGTVLKKCLKCSKWSVEEITEEDKKYPLNEEDEYRTVHQQRI